MTDTARAGLADALSEPAAAGAARGLVAPGWEPVARELERVVRETAEEGVAVCVTVEGEPVVDLQSGNADGGPWTAETLALTFSCTKGALALCAQILYDRGLLDPDARVVEYWPEYGVNGKEATLVKHFLRHSAGVVSAHEYWKHIAPDGRGLDDWDLMTGLLASTPPSWEPGTLTSYHAITYGYLLGEIVRRISGKMPGAFFAEEVAGPLGLDYSIGIPEAMLGRATPSLAPVPDDLDHAPEPLRQFILAWRPIVEAARQKVIAGDALSLEALPWSVGFLPREPIDVDVFTVQLFNQPWLRTAQVPAGNGIGTARGLARMYAMLALGGELDGVRVVSPESIARFAGFDGDLGLIPVGIGLGYHGLLAEWIEAGGSPRSFGHSGHGGMMAFADPDRRLSFAYLKNRVSLNPTALDVARVVFDCAGR